MSVEDDERLELEGRLRVLLPETYQVFDDEVQPRSMGSAGLKYGADGKVPWNEMWGSFCDLAMAGGPPHRGALLEPDRDRGALKTPAYEAAAAEICRGVFLVTGLYAEPAPTPGWVRMYCTSAAMAAWLVRAIVMENVSAIGEGLALYLPTGPTFRVEKEIKNVITATAKTCHYWQDHMSDTKHEEIAGLLATMEREAPLVFPENATSRELEVVTRQVAETIVEATGLERSTREAAGWVGLDCRSVPAAVWMMRALAVSNVLSRREETTVFLPVNVAVSSDADRSVQAMIWAHRLAVAAKIFG